MGMVARPSSPAKASCPHLTAGAAGPHLTVGPRQPPGLSPRLSLNAIDLKIGTAVVTALCHGVHDE